MDATERLQTTYVLKGVQDFEKVWEPCRHLTITKARRGPLGVWEMTKEPLSLSITHFFAFLFSLYHMYTSPLAGGAAVSPSALPQCLCGSGGNPILRVLLANVVRCSSRPGTTVLDAGHSASVIWKQGNRKQLRLAPYHNSPSYLSPLRSARLAPPPFPLRVHAESHELCHRCTQEGGAHSLSQLFSLCTVQSADPKADPHEGASPPTRRR